MVGEDLPEISTGARLVATRLPGLPQCLEQGLREILCVAVP